MVAAPAAGAATSTAAAVVNSSASLTMKARTQRSAPTCGLSAVGFAQRALHVALALALLDRLALVEAVLAAGERDLDLRARALEVDARRDEREAALLDARLQALDLAPVDEQLARALGLVVLARGGRVGRDVHVVQPQLAVAEGGVAVLDLHATLAQRLDLRPLQHEAGLDLVEELVAVGRVAVARDVPRIHLALLAGGHVLAA